MSKIALPVKLKENIIVDAVFELRFAADKGFSDLLPGSARGLFGEVRAIEKTPVSNLPQQVREMDPNLHYQPTIRMVWDDVVLVIGDRTLGVGYGDRYPGWATFKNHIEILLSGLRDFGLARMIRKVDRYSFKYIDFIPERFSAGLESPYSVQVALGNKEVKNSPIKLQVERQESFGVCFFEFANPVNVQVDNNPVETGTLISVDSVRFFSSGIDWESFQQDFINNAEKIHDKNKEGFFETLSEELLEKLGAEYV